MRSSCSLVLLIAAAVPAQEVGPAADKSPEVTHSIRFAGGASFTVRYRSIPWRVDKQAAELDKPVGSTIVLGEVMLDGKLLEGGRYDLLFARNDDAQWHLVLRNKHGVRRGFRLGLEADPERRARLEIVVAPGRQHDEGSLRLAFAECTTRLTLETTKQPVPSAVAAQVEAARVELRAIKDAVMIWMVRNPGKLPSWRDLITPDARGQRFVELDDPKRDPWGNEYVITSHPEYPRMPRVLSWGPDGAKDTADDIHSDQRRRTAPVAAPAEAKARARGAAETAALEAAQIHKACILFMVRNPKGGIPTWAMLITPDQRGHRYLRLDEPAKDPWGNSYEISSDPAHDDKPLVTSRGPDGVAGTADDVTSAGARRKQKTRD